MGKIAVVFSGQGAQHVGMGKRLYDTNASVKELFDRAESLRPGTLAQMFEGDAETLKQTENTQPCLYLADLAAVIALKDAGLSFDCAAGFSLGELPALAFGGAYSYEDGFRLACVRGALMGEATKEQATGMVAVMKMENAAVEAVCAEFNQVYPVNYNSPGQLVVAGAADEIPAFCEKIKQAGGRSLPLKVSGGFHSPFMENSAKKFRAELDNFDIKVPAFPVYSDYTAELYSENPRDLLGKQIHNPVRWENIIRKMGENGVDTFIEAGVGTVLQKLVTKILPDAKAYAAETPEQIAEIVAEVGV